MKNILIFITFLFATGSLQSQEWIWGIKASGDNQLPEDSEIDVDNDGNMVIAAYYEQNFGFEPYSLFTEDDHYADIYLCRIDANQNVQWLNHIETENTYDKSIGLEQDDDKNIYISAAKDGYAFVSKYDSTGVLLWTNDFNREYYGYGRDIAVDQFDNVYVVGGDGWNFFAAKLDYYGDTVWVKNLWFNYSNACYVNEIDVDRLGNIYFCGSFGIDVLQLGDFELIHDVGYGEDTFWGRMSTDGEFLWIKSSFGRTNKHTQIALTEDNFLYISGSFKTELEFDSILVQGAFMQSPNPYIAKYDTEGNVQWAILGHSTYQGRGVPTDIVVDMDNNIYLSGEYFTCYGISCTENDYYLEKYDEDGEHIWRKEFQMYSPDFAQGIEIDNHGYAYLLGYNRSGNFIDTSNIESIRTAGIGKLHTLSSTTKRPERPKIERIRFICEGSPMEPLVATGAEIKWYDDPLLNNLIHTGSIYDPSITSTDTFYVTQTFNGIESWPKETIIYFSELPEVELTASYDTLMVDSFHFFNFQWLYEDDSIDGATDHYIIADTAGKFSVIISEGECERRIDTIFAPNSVDLYDITEALQIFPNPTKSGVLFVKYNYKANPTKFNIKVSDIQGVVILNKEVTGENGVLIERIDLSNYPEGLYLLNLSGYRINISAKILRY